MAVRPWPELEYSKSQVKKAGKILRRHHREVLAVREDEVEWALQVARNWRRAHSEAENWAQMGCRSRLATLGIDGDVTQRLKELPTIIQKLVREGNRVQLSTMEDVAGARAVVDTVEQLRRLEERWMDSKFTIHRHRDYIDGPQPSGYRGVHLVLEHHDRLVEVQLRTRIQHRWAELVEQLGHDLGVALKNGEGPDDVLARLSDLSMELSGVERGDESYADKQQRADDAVRLVRSEVRRGAT